MAQAVCDSITSAKRAAAAPVRSLQPTTATTNPNLSQTNLLAELDRAAQEVIDAIVQAQANAEHASSPVIELGGLSAPVTLPRRMSLPEMRRQKRNFVKLSTQNSFSKLKHAGSGRQMFIDFLQDAVD